MTVALQVTSNWYVFAAFGAGVISFLSPCVLPIVPGYLSLVTGLSVEDVSRNAVANLGWDDIRLTAPVFAGDTLYAESEVLEVRESRSRPGQGGVRVATKGLNQDGVVVIEFERTVLVHSRTTRPG